MPSPTPNYIAVFNQQNAPIDGMYSCVAPEALRKGMYGLIQNWRCDKRKMRVRDGIAQLSPSSPWPLVSNAEYRGHFEGLMFDGTSSASYLIVATTDDAGLIQLWKVNQTTFAGTKLTTAPYDAGTNAVKYGSSEMTDNGRVSFQVVRDKWTSPERDVLICFNGASARVYDPSNTDLGGFVAIADEITISNTLDQYNHKALAKLSSTMAVAGASLPTYTNKDADMTIADTGSSPDNNCRISITTAVDVDDWVKLDKSSIDLTKSRELLFVVDDDYDVVASIWKMLKVEISEDNSTFHVIWDGSSQTYADPVIWPMEANSTKYLVAFNHEHVVSTGKNATRYIRISFVGTPALITGTVTLNIYCIGGTGWIRGGAQFGNSLTNSGSRMDSAGRTLANGGGKRLKDMGGTPLSNMELPVIPLISYCYDLPYIRATAAQFALGVDKVRWYIKEDGDSDFFLIQEDREATFSAGTWAFSGSAEVLATLTVGTSRVLKDPTLPIPPPDHQVIPQGRHSATGADRLWTGNITGASTEVWGSRALLPFRWLSYTPETAFGTPEISGPVRLIFDGEQVQGIVRLPTSQRFADAFTIFTDKSVYEAAGYDAWALSMASRVLTVGTLSPYAIAVYDGLIGWVDSHMQVRIGREIVSRYDVDDKLQGIPAARRDDLVMAFHRDCLYLGYTPEGGSNNSRILVRNMIEGKWQADDLIPGSTCRAEGLGVWLDRTNNRPRLLCFGPAGSKLFEYEQPGLTTDLGSNIVTALRLQYTMDAWLTLFVNRLGFHIDRATNGTIAVVATLKPDGATQTWPTLDVSTPATGQAFKWVDMEGVYSPVDPTDTWSPSIQIDITATLPGATNLHAIVLEPSDTGPQERGRSFE